MEKEIILNLELSSEQEALLEMHSFLNVMNVLIAEISLLAMQYDKESEMESVVSHCFDITRALSNKLTAIEAAKNIDATKSIILDGIKNQIGSAIDISTETYYLKTIDNINSIFNILDVRIREIMARINDPEQWIEFEIGLLQNNFVNVFNAIEKNSKGRYRIIYNVAEHDVKNYLVNLSFRSENGKTIKMPPVLQDVMRDLIANARKYTEPGGRIDAGLVDDGKFLKFVVQDTGMGIPDEQIEQIVNFGFRAGNVTEKVTRGGGFGLTKAYFVTKQFFGRMWIDSVLNQGTKITIILPHK